MRHWVGRIDLPSRNITAIKEFDSEEEANDYINNTNAENEEINKYNNQLKVAKSNLPLIIPEFDKEIHKSLTQYLKLKKKLRQEFAETLNEDDLKIHKGTYKLNLVPKGTKLVYMKIYD